MAFLPPEQQNQQAPTGVTNTTSGTGTPPPQTGGSAGTGAGASKAGTPQSAGTPTQFGSSASKLGDYLTANAPQIQNQAQSITNQLNTSYGQVGQDINNSANQFGQSVAAGYAAPNQSVVDQATQNPVGFASTPANVSAFQGQYNDQYTGPQNYESTTPYANIQNEVNQAVTDAGLFNTQAGLQNYFANTGGPNSTQASNTLDSLLLQGNPQSQQQILGAANQFQNLTPQFQNTVTAADQSVQAAQQAAQQAQQYAQGQFGNAVTGFNTNLNNELTNAQTGATQFNQNINNLGTSLANGQLPTGYGTDTGLQSFLTNNVTPWMTKYGGTMPTYNFANAVSGLPQANAPMLNQVASPNDFATYNALNQLAGSQITSPLNGENPALAGTYNLPTAPTINNNALAGDLFSALQPSQNAIINKPYYDPNAQNSFYGLLTALNQYQGNPWYQGTGNTDINQPNPYSSYQPAIS